MDPLAQQITQRFVHLALPLDAVEPGESGALDHDGEVRFAARIVPGMTGMVAAVVDHGELRRGERSSETGGDFGGDGAGSGIGHRAYIGRLARLGSRVARTAEKKDRPNTRFHGRVEGSGRACDAPGCAEAGEFRAPPLEGPSTSFEGPRPYRWFCLDHVRAFNAGYNFFEGMTADEIHHQQRPYAGWERETRAFAANGADRPPRWADFADPLDAIGARFRQAQAETQRKDGKPLSGNDRKALMVLGLDQDADRMALRKRYSELVRRYHPDRNGGDRSKEHALQEVIAAYQQLRAAPAFV
jgi:hypothetical protein